MKREFHIVDRKCCPQCGCTENETIWSLYDDRYGQADLYDIVECSNSQCQLGYLKQPIAEKELSRLYSKYYHHHNVNTALSWPLNYIRQLLKKARDVICNNDNLYSRLKYGQRVLDVGSGYGPTNKHFLKSSAIDWVGLEVDPRKVAAIRGKGLCCEPLSLEQYAK